MARFVPDPHVLRLGEALAALRRQRGLSQAEAGARLEMTSQGWGLYEAGRRPGLFRPDVQRRLTGALDSTPEALALLAAGGPDAAPAGPAAGLEARGRAFSGASIPQTHRLEVTDDALSPWADRGVVLEYRPGRPRPGQGCVILTTDGRRLARIFDRSAADGLHVRGAGRLEGKEVIDPSRVAQLCLVTARHEP